jgi:hypothetical protein
MLTHPREEGVSGLKFSVLREELGTGLRGPPPDAGHQRKTGVGLVTGGGLVAALDSLGGLVGLWQGGALLLSGVEIWVGRQRARPTAEFRWRGGAWTGGYDLGAGIRLTERGLLPDAAAAAVFEWTVGAADSEGSDAPAAAEDSNAVQVRIVFAAGAAGTQYEIGLSVQTGASTAVAVIPPGGDPSAIERLVKPLRARERQRAERGRPGDEQGFTVSRNGRPLPSIVEALRSIDDAAVTGANDDAPIQVVGGLAHGAPAYLEGESLALFGTAAVYSGRTWLATRVLHSLAAPARTHPLPYLSFAATYALWTADLGPIASMRSSLTGALDALADCRSTKASNLFPALAERLAAAIEPLGDRALSGRLRAHARAATPAATRGPGNRRGGYGGPLAAARLLRCLVERDLGLDADASYGRLRFAPRLEPSSRPLDVTGVRAGDARVRIGISASRTRHELRILQESGRVPLNLVFSPWLAGRTEGPLTVLLDGSQVEPDLRTTAGGTRVLMQFPLDRPRNIVIITGAS